MSTWYTLLQNKFSGKDVDKCLDYTAMIHNLPRREVELYLVKYYGIYQPIDKNSCFLKKRCPGGYRKAELQSIARECGINDVNMTMKNLCLAIREKIREADEFETGYVVESLYDVMGAGVMLAQDYINKRTGKNLIDDPVGWLASEKFDGVRAIWNGYDFISRDSGVFVAPEWYKKIMPQVALDGELFIGRENFHLTVGAVKKKVPVNKEWAQVKYMVFDLPNSQEGAEQRVKQYHQIVKESCQEFKPNKFINKCPLIAVDQAKITSPQGLKRLYNEIVSSGGEGLILRKPKSRYVGKRSRDLLKYKPSFDDEAIVIGYEEGTGRNEGRLGALRVQLLKDKDIQFNIGTGFSDELRDNYLNEFSIGTIITFQHKGFTHTNTPRHPVYMRVRTDMNNKMK